MPKKTEIKKSKTTSSKSKFEINIPDYIKYLIIHESPKETSTVRAFLPKDYIALPTLWHFMSSPSDKLGIDEESWEIELKPDKNKKSAIESIEKAIAIVRKNNWIIYIITDPDREWEVIGSEVVLNFKLKKWEYKHPHITSLGEKEYLKGLKEAKDDLDWNKVEAGMTRQILDKYVWFKFTEILWKLSWIKYKETLTKLSDKFKDKVSKFKERNKEVFEKNKNIQKVINNFETIDLGNLLNFKERLGISIWRVQTPTLRLLVEKELEKLEKDLERKINILALDSKGLEWEFDQNSKKETDVDYMTKAFNLFNSALKENRIVGAKVVDIQENIKNIQPPEPLNTSWIQTSVNAEFWFNLKQIMNSLQNLYEQGYTTYMRTDAIEVPDSYKEYLMEMIKSSWNKFVNKNYVSKNNAQAWHHAILPTKAYKLNDLPWNLDSKDLKILEYVIRRSAAAFMEPAKIKYLTYKLELTLKNKEGKELKVYFLFKDTEVLEKWFMDIFNYNLNKYNKLTSLKNWDSVEIKEFILKEKDIKLPWSYSEGSIVKELESLGIWRPSTYETIVSTLKEKNYIKVEGKIDITPKGYWTYETIKEDSKLFWQIFDLEFTAQMETWLDEIAEWKKNRKDILPLIKKQFEEAINLIWTVKVDDSVSTSGISSWNNKSQLEEKCPKCWLNLEQVSFKTGKKAKKCSWAKYDFKEKKNIGCDYIEWINEENWENKEPKKSSTENVNKPCPTCWNPLVKVVTANGKKMFKCSTQTWSPKTWPQGCPFVKWINSEEDETEFLSS